MTVPLFLGMCTLVVGLSLFSSDCSLSFAWFKMCSMCMQLSLNRIHLSSYSSILAIHGQNKKGGVTDSLE